MSETVSLTIHTIIDAHLAKAGNRFDKFIVDDPLQYALGELYTTGDLHATNPCNHTAEHYDVYCLYVARYYRSDNRDNNAAHEWYKKSIAHHYPYAVASYASFLRICCDDLDAAIKLLTATIERGPPHTILLSELGSIYGIHRKDRVLQKRYLTMLPDEDNQLCYFQLGHYYHTSAESDEPNHIKHAMKYYKLVLSSDKLKQARNIVAGANTNIATILIHSRRDPAAAIPYLIQAVCCATIHPADNIAISMLRKYAHKYHYTFMAELRGKCVDIRAMDVLREPTPKLRQFMASHRVKCPEPGEECLMCFVKASSQPLYHYSCSAHHYCLQCLYGLYRHHRRTCPVCQFPLHPSHEKLFSCDDVS